MNSLTLTYFKNTKKVKRVHIAGAKQVLRKCGLVCTQQPCTATTHIMGGCWLWRPATRTATLYEICRPSTHTNGLHEIEFLQYGATNKNKPQGYVKCTKTIQVV
jgi:hypothetical protein